MSNMIQDNSKDRDYFVITPQLVWALCETPAEKVLWDVVKMIAGETSECWIGTDDLSTLAMVSKPTLIRARRRLIEIGLLNGKLKKHEDFSDNAVWHLSIPNLWKQNVEWRDKYQKLKGENGRIAFKAAQRAARKNREDTNTQVLDGIVPLGGSKNIDRGGSKNIDRGVVKIFTGGSKNIDHEEEPAKKNPIKKNPELTKGLGNNSQSINEPIRENLDPYGDEIPRKFDKYDPFFQEIRMKLFGSPSNLQGRERLMWEQLLKRIMADRDFIEWMRWQAENNSLQKTFSFFYAAVMNETHYAKWQDGEFVVKSDLPEIIAGRTSRPTQRPHSELDDVFASQAQPDGDLEELFNNI